MYFRVLWPWIWAICPFWVSRWRGYAYWPPFHNTLHWGFHISRLELHRWWHWEYWRPLGLLCHFIFLSSSISFDFPWFYGWMNLWRGWNLFILLSSLWCPFQCRCRPAHLPLHECRNCIRPSMSTPSHLSWPFRLNCRQQPFHLP